MIPATSKIDSQQIHLALNNGRHQIQDLFIYTSLLCNKSCHHCFVSSTPTNHTLNEMTCEDLDPVWSELTDIKAKNIYFTGGEVFINKQIISMLKSAMVHAPVTIYTNASRPLEKHFETLRLLNSEHIDRHNKPILLRVSLDHIDPDIHNVYYGRGDGSWEESLKLTIEAAKSGFDISITTQADIHNQAPDSWIMRSFIKLFQNQGVELLDVKVLPDIPTGKHAEKSFLTDIKKFPMSRAEFAMTGTSLSGLMCHTGRTLIKLKGKLQVYPCTLIIPDRKENIPLLESYSMAETLNDSLSQGQKLDHPACRAYCVVGKQSCAN